MRSLVRTMLGTRRLGAGILVGLFVGTLLLTPAGAHINSNTKHVIKHLIKSGFVRPARTVLVSPTGTPAQSGAALLAAVGNIDSASASEPWLVKVEPGSYDLGAQTLELPPFVDLEGSGRSITTIRCACASTSNTDVGEGSVVHLDASSALRSLSVLNNATGDHRHGVDISGEVGRARLDDVEVIVDGAPGFASGVWVGSDAGADIRDAKVQVSGSGATRAWGIRTSLGTVLDVTDSEVSVSDGDEAYGIHIDGSTARITDTSVAVKGTSTDNYGVWSGGSNVVYTDVTSKASNGPRNVAFHIEATDVGEPAILRGVQALAVGGGDQYFAVRVVDADARIEHSRLVAKGVEGYGLTADLTLDDTANRSITVTNSSIEAEGSIIQEGIQSDTDGMNFVIVRFDNGEIFSVDGRWLRLNGRSYARFGGSFIVGNQALNQGAGNFHCAGVWDEEYTVLYTDDCPDP